MSKTFSSMLVQIFTVAYCTAGMPSPALEDSELLSELPLEKLLLKKQSVLSELSRCNGENSKPVAAALIKPLDHMQIRGNFIDRGHYDVEEGGEDEEWEWMPMSMGKGKIGKIFEGSVTALAFLAFAGYLLCLVVQVVKDKHETQSTVQAQTASLYQHFLAQQLHGQRPGAPVRVPAVSIHSGRRRRRSGRLPPAYQPGFLSNTTHHHLLVELINNAFTLSEMFVNKGDYSKNKR